MNEQEAWWSGDWGNSYTRRNRVEWEKRVPFWSQILDVTQAQSVLDVGCNAGWNMRAIKAANSEVRVFGIDVNSDAVGEARSAELDATVASITDTGMKWLNSYDLVVTAGVLIHISPEHLKGAMKNIVAASKRWVLAVEYDAPQEEQIVYRGNTERLWKRPFGKLYEALGLKVVAESEASGFDQCRAWLMVKP